MDKAIIFGIYDFVSFHACKILLNKGIEVVGVLYDERENISFYEEKTLEVGRNANFLEQTFSSWAAEQLGETDGTVLIISLYDLYMLKKETIIQKEKLGASILQFLEENQSMDIVLLMPVQQLISGQDQHLEAFLEQARKQAGNMQVIYLPAVYGPWQPESFLFQQTILSCIGKVDEAKADREWTEDILFVNDAVHTIIELMEKGSSGEYLLNSGKIDYWSECAAYLNINETLVKTECTHSLKLGNQIVKVPVQPITPIEESITEQVEHVRRLYEIE